MQRKHQADKDATPTGQGQVQWRCLHPHSGSFHHLKEYIGYTFKRLACPAATQRGPASASLLAYQSMPSCPEACHLTAAHPLLLLL